MGWKATKYNIHWLPTAAVLIVHLRAGIGSPPQNNSASSSISGFLPAMMVANRLEVRGKIRVM